MQVQDVSLDQVRKSMVLQFYLMAQELGNETAGEETFVFKGSRFLLQ
jgi:hypothetical protein